MKRLALLTVFLIAASACTKKSGENHVVEMRTSAGVIVIELDSAKAPISVENFIKYANDGFYDGTIFHRVIPNFMIQGGGFDSKMEQKKTNAPIQNEASNGLSNTAMTISMARTNDPNSATAQFFINLVDNSRLDKNPGSAGYAVFGRVILGEDIVKKIGTVPTTTKGMYSDVPVETVTIEKVTVKK